MNQSQPMTRLEVVDIETNVATKTIYLVGHNALEIQQMSDSLLRNLNTFQFFVRATPGAAPKTIDCREFHELAMDYRAAAPFVEAGKAYQRLVSYIDAQAQKAV